MKKMLALVLCLMLVLSASAFAETATTGFGMVISEVQLNLGEAVVLNPSVFFAFGQQTDGAWMELGVQNGDTTMFDAQFDIANDVITASVEGANDALKLTGADAYLAVQDLTTADLISSFEEAAAMLDAETLDATMDALPTLLEGLVVENLGDLNYKLSYEEEGMSASLCVRFVLNPDKEFDLSGKNVVEISDLSDTENYPDNDVIAVAFEQLEVLLTEESVASFTSLFTGLLESADYAA